MPANDHTAHSDRTVNRQDPSTWLAPGEKLIGADGRDWAWCYVIYKEVAGFPAYCVGTNGVVWSRLRRKPAGRGNQYGKLQMVLGDTWKRLKGVAHAYGYRYITLSTTDAGGSENRPIRGIHSLVLETHDRPCPPGLQCRHLNGHHADNRAWNLVWGTARENAADRERHGTKLSGEKIGTARLSDDQVPEIRRLYASGMTQMQIAAMVGIHQTHISRILAGKCRIQN